MSRHPAHDADLLDLTGPGQDPAGSSQSDSAYDQWRGTVEKAFAESEAIPERKRPWLIDIFLYPLNRAGIMAILICAGVPFLLQAVTEFLNIARMAFLPFAVFWALSLVLFWISVGVFLLYMNWYACECIRDSSHGQIRAADTAASTPGFIELVAQGLLVATCVALAGGPAIIYYTETRQTDAILWILCGVAAFLLPMALLSVAMYDALQGLNPIRMIGAISKTLPQYAIRTPFCIPVCALVPLAIYYFLEFWVLGHVLTLAAYYAWLVLAHQLGRFFYKNDETLNWDV